MISRWDAIKKALLRTPLEAKTLRRIFSSGYWIRQRFIDIHYSKDTHRMSWLRITVKSHKAHALSRSSSAWRNRTKRNWTVIDGSSTPSALWSNQTVRTHIVFTRPVDLLIASPVCILLDVGTKPTGTSIYELWKCKSARIPISDLGPTLFK